MNFELISEEEYDNLPDDDEDCFVAFEAICRRNMNRMISEDTTREFDKNVRQQYMAAVSAVGRECSVPNTQTNEHSDDSFDDEFRRFSLAVHGEVARIRIRGRGFRHPYSVRLLPNTKAKIENYISRIRDTIEKSDLSDDRRRALYSKLDNFQAELDSPRLSFGKTMAVLSVVLAGLAASTTIAAEGPAAVNNIMKLIAADKETEDAARLRLAPPPKALPAPPQPQKPQRPAVRRTTGPSWDAPKGGDLDDEIPF